MTGSQPVVGEQPDAEEVGKQGGWYADEANEPQDSTQKWDHLSFKKKS